MKDIDKQEEREAERLVREAPKQKPPRRDKRRNVVQVIDPDTSGDPDLKNKDMSLNYKGVTSSAERIKAINKNDDIVYVSPDTMKDRPGEYKPVKDDDNGKPKDEKPSSEKSKTTDKGPSKAKSPETQGKDPSGTQERPPMPVREPATRAEQKQAHILLADHLPAKLAARFIAKNIHPDDAKEIIRNYKSEKSKPLGSDIAKDLSVGAAVFQTDPDEVEPPTSWITSSGEKVPFSSLSSEEQSVAYRQHQMRVVALTIATADKLQDHFEMKDAKGRPRVPRDVAEAMVNSAMNDSVANHAIAKKKTKLVALQTTNQEQGYSHEALAEATSHSKELERQSETLASNLQAVEKDSPEHKALTKELSDLNAQRSGLGKKVSQMREALESTDNLQSEVDTAEMERSEESTDQADALFDNLLNTARPTAQMSPTERQALLKSVQGTPGTAKALEAYLASNDYRSVKKKLAPKLSERSSPKDLLNTLLEARSSFEPFGGRPNQGMDHFESTVLDNLKSLAPHKYHEVRDGLDAADAKAYKAAHKAYVKAKQDWDSRDPADRGDPPKKPREPVSYGLDEPGSDLETVAKVATKNAGRVKGSSYPTDLVMATHHKKALYHGVDPSLSRVKADPVDMQGNPAHVSEAAFAAIVAEAKAWLSKPALKVTPDYQAPYEALDLALATGPYSTVPPQLYAKLLEAIVGKARLAAMTLDRPRLEAAVYRKFTNDSKMKRNGELMVMLTGTTATVLKRDSYDMVALSSLTDKELDTLAKVFKIKTAASMDSSLEKITINIEGVVTPDLVRALTTTPFTYRDESGLTVDEGFMTLLNHNESSLVVGVPKGSRPYALQVIEKLCRHQATIKVASVQSNQSRGVSPTNQVPENTMLKLSSAQVVQINEALTRLDKMAAAIQKNAQTWGMPFNEAKALVVGIDKTADAIETLAFGQSNLQTRQAELALSDPKLAAYVRETVGSRAYAKAAKVIQRDADETFMDTFNAPSKVIEADADEEYMDAFADDQTVGLVEGKEENGTDIVSY